MKTDFRPFNIIEKVFGEDFSVKKKNISNLPFIYSKNFTYYDVEGSFAFILIIPNGEEAQFDLVKGIYIKIQQDFKKRVVVYLANSSATKKELFIESKISFVSSDGDHQLFEQNKNIDIFNFNEDVYKESYTKTTQLIVNFYLCNEIREYSVREIASKFDFSYASVSRANAFLHEIGAVDKIGTDNLSKYIIKSKKDLLEKVKPFLINPIKNRKMTIINKKEIIESKGFLSGENALSYYSDLDHADEFIELAFNKINYHNIKSSDNDGIICYLEEFIYDPSYFSHDNVISPLDAYIISSRRYNGNDDPRIKSAIKQLERRIINAD